MLVHGAGSARWSFDAVRPHLEGRFTVIAIDRRGRGDSTDGDEYARERECAEVAAGVRAAGAGALLMGHPYGGRGAAGAAEVRVLPRLALYEPAMGWGLATGATIERWERMIEAGERDAVVREFYRDIAGYDEDAIDELARGPVWEARRQIVHTVPRELRAELAHRFDPDALAALTMPVLLLLGTESPDWAVRSVRAYADAIPGAELCMLEGQGHAANMKAPELLAGELERFLAR